MLHVLYVIFMFLYLDTTIKSVFSQQATRPHLNLTPNVLIYFTVFCCQLTACLWKMLYKKNLHFTYLFAIVCNLYNSNI